MIFNIVYLENYESYKINLLIYFKYFAQNNKKKKIKIMIIEVCFSSFQFLDKVIPVGVKNLK